MREAYQGGCACGAVRYEISGEPVFQNHCQCRDCQHKSGTGHGSYLTFNRDGVNLTGAVKGWDIVADSGNVKTRAFCPTCGSPLTITFAAMPQFIAVHAASLDDPSRFQAAGRYLYEPRARLGQTRSGAAGLREDACVTPAPKAGSDHPLQFPEELREFAVQVGGLKLQRADGFHQYVG